jgi:hypothetical protein
MNGSALAGPARGLYRRQLTAQELEILRRDTLFYNTKFRSIDRDPE